MRETIILQNLSCTPMISVLRWAYRSWQDNADLNTSLAQGAAQHLLMKPLLCHLYARKLIRSDFLLAMNFLPISHHLREKPICCCIPASLPSKLARARRKTNSAHFADNPGPMGRSKQGRAGTLQCNPSKLPFGRRLFRGWNDRYW